MVNKDGTPKYKNNSFDEFLVGASIGTAEGGEILSTNISKNGILTIVTKMGQTTKKKEKISFDLKQPNKLDEIIDAHLDNTSGKQELSQSQEQKMRVQLRNSMFDLFKVNDDGKGSQFGSVKTKTQLP